MLLRRALIGALFALALGSAGAAQEGAAPPAPAREISWEEALALIRGGEVVSVMQRHDLGVTLRTADGESHATREPEIDAVIRAVRTQAPNAGQIAIATE